MHPQIEDREVRVPDRRGREVAEGAGSGGDEAPLAREAGSALERLPVEREVGLVGKGFAIPVV